MWVNEPFATNASYVSIVGIGVIKGGQPWATGNWFELNPN
jgi:hypothetical protein